MFNFKNHIIMAELKGFVAMVVAILTGDDAEVTALKIQKKGKAALKAQIAVKEAATLELEEQVEVAQEALELARVNRGEVITNNNTYISNLLGRRRDLEAAEKNLEVHLETIEFLKKELEIVSK